MRYLQASEDRPTPADLQDPPLTEAEVAADKARAAADRAEWETIHASDLLLLRSGIDPGPYGDGEPF